MPEATPNHDQERYWNEQAGRRWVANERDLDAQLEPFGVAVAERLGLAQGERVLDVGCGAGATTMMLANRVRPGEVVGIDISAPLLTRARERSRGIEHLRFELCDAQTSAFDAASFDAIFSRFGVMFFANPVAAFANLRGALRAGGKLGFICWRAMHDNPSFVLPLEAALPFLPEPPPAPDPVAPGPFAFADEGRLRGILDRAGYADIEIARRDAEMVVGGREGVEGAVDLAFQVGPLSRALPELSEEGRARVRAAVRAAFLPHAGPSGVTLPSATWLVTARRAS